MRVDVSNKEGKVPSCVNLETCFLVEDKGPNDRVREGGPEELDEVGPSVIGFFVCEVLLRVSTLVVVGVGYQPILVLLRAKSN